ncbi:Gag polyprotein [Bienertia sinuspersici]
MMSKGKVEEKGDHVCLTCGKKGHKAKRCCTIVGSGTKEKGKDWLLMLRLKGRVKNLCLLLNRLNNY